MTSSDNTLVSTKSSNKTKMYLKLYKNARKSDTEIQINILHLI